MKASAPHTNTL